MKRMTQVGMILMFMVMAQVVMAAYGGSITNEITNVTNNYAGAFVATAPIDSAFFIKTSSIVQTPAIGGNGSLVIRGENAYTLGNSTISNNGDFDFANQIQAKTLLLSSSETVVGLATFTGDIISTGTKANILTDNLQVANTSYHGGLATFNGNIVSTGAGLGKIEGVDIQGKWGNFTSTVGAGGLITAYANIVSTGAGLGKIEGVDIQGKWANFTGTCTAGGNFTGAGTGTFNNIKSTGAGLGVIEGVDIQGKWANFTGTCTAGGNFTGAGTGTFNNVKSTGAGLGRVDAVDVQTKWICAQDTVTVGGLLSATGGLTAGTGSYVILPSTVTMCGYMWPTCAPVGGDYLRVFASSISWGH